MVLFTAVWIFWYKSVSHHLLKITVTSLLLINLLDHLKTGTIDPENAQCRKTPKYDYESQETQPVSYSSYSSAVIKCLVEILILWSH